MKRNTFVLGSILSFLIGLPVYAQVLGANNLQGLVVAVVNVLNSLILLVGTLAIVVFIWSLVRFLATSGEDSAKRKEWKSYMIYAIIAFCVIAGLWGIINATLNLFGLTNIPATQVIPQFNTSGDTPS